MSRILLATDSYHFAPTANGICVEEIADELKKQGHDVHVLCFRHGKESYEDHINGIKIHRIKMDWVNRLRFLYEKKLSGWKQIVVKDMMVFLNRVEAMLFLYWFPMRSFLFCERYKRRIEGLQKKYNYDIIVSSYSPFEAAYSIAKMNKKYNTKKCLYTLDSLTNLKQRFFLSHEYQDKKGWKWEQKIYNQCDLILNLKCHERHYSQSRYDKFRAKMKIVDIPHMIPFDIEADQGNLSGYTMLYAGNFYKDIAKDVFDVLSDYILSDTLTLEIYGRNDRESLQGFTTNEVAEKIVFGGFLDRQEILKKEKQTDILLSIGCPGTDFISSKIFEYITFGGKILHLYKGKNDPNYKYFEKYKNACCINLEFSMDDNKKRIEEFLRTKTERIPFEQISELYKENLPSYTTQFIAGESNKSWGGVFHVLYAGAIRNDIMLFALQYFAPLMEQGQLVFDLYTRSSISEYRKHISEKANEKLIMHGFKEREVILEKEREADILLAMGNSDSDFISSKIFELIATGKKIIHIYSYKKDSALPYFERYPNCCLLNVHDGTIKNVEKIVQFLKAEAKYISFKELEKIYYMNTPYYTVNKIMELTNQ